jgi:maltose O-acetyltransferase
VADPFAGDPRSNRERMLAGGLGEDTWVRAPFYVDHGENLTTGARTFVNFNLVALGVAPIAIGDNVCLGGGAIVLPGVTIGADSIVGAGAVVTKDVPAGVLAVGNPARVVRSLGSAA